MDKSAGVTNRPDILLHIYGKRHDQEHEAEK